MQWLNKLKNIAHTYLEYNIFIALSTIFFTERLAVHSGIAFFVKIVCDAG